MEYHFVGKNLGYGAGHNYAIRKMIDRFEYHLVVNPDIYFEVGVLDGLIGFMDAHREVGLVSPKILYPDGSIQYLSKRLPKPLDLFGRRFLPFFMLQKRRDYLEMRETGYDREMDSSFLSGCFMFFRTEALLQVGLFDERFFLYCEDLDITRRIAERYRCVFLPSISVFHHFGKGSYKSLRMLGIHVVSAVRYFNKWGWFPLW